MNILKDASAAAIYGSRGSNGVIIITTRKGVSGKIRVNYSNNIGIRQASNLVTMANAAEYANYVQATTGNTIESNPIYQNNTNWYDVILRTAFTTTNNISIYGGSEQDKYMLNIGYFTDQGIVKNNDFKRLTLRFNNDWNIRNDLLFNLTSSYSNAINQNGFGNIDIDPDGKIGGVYK